MALLRRWNIWMMFLLYVTTFFVLFRMSFEYTQVKFQNELTFSSSDGANCHRHHCAYSQVYSPLSGGMNRPFLALESLVFLAHSPDAHDPTAVGA
jgi:hypothetical protein